MTTRREDGLVARSQACEAVVSSRPGTGAQTCDRRGRTHVHFVVRLCQLGVHMCMLLRLATTSHPDPHVMSRDPGPVGDVRTRRPAGFGPANCLLTNLCKRRPQGGPREIERPHEREKPLENTAAAVREVAASHQRRSRCTNETSFSNRRSSSRCKSRRLAKQQNYVDNSI